MESGRQYPAYFGLNAWPIAAAQRNSSASASATQHRWPRARLHSAFAAAIFKRDGPCDHPTAASTTTTGMAWKGPQLWRTRHESGTAEGIHAALRGATDPERATSNSGCGNRTRARLSSSMAETVLQSPRQLVSLRLRSCGATISFGRNGKPERLRSKREYTSDSGRPSLGRAA